MRIVCFLLNVYMFDHCDGDCNRTNSEQPSGWLIMFSIENLLQMDVWRCFDYWGMRYASVSFPILQEWFIIVNIYSRGIRFCRFRLQQCIYMPLVQLANCWTTAKKANRSRSTQTFGSRYSCQQQVHIFSHKYARVFKNRKTLPLPYKLHFWRLYLI